MTREEVLAMKPGRELDAKVAVEIFGWSHVAEYGTNAFDPALNMWFGVPPGRQFVTLNDEPHLPSMIDNPLPHYSTSIADAWPVVEEIKNRGKVFVVKADGLMRGDFQPAYLAWCGNMEVVRAVTAPEAICKAALIATLVNQ